MTRDIHLTVGGVVADSITNLPTIQIGEDTPLNLRFRENNLPNVFDSPEERHQRLFRIVQWANQATVKVDRSSEGVSNYRETVPSRAPVESFIHPVQFAEGVDRTPDFWAAIRGGEDTREPGVDRTSLRLDATVLALIDEYDSRQEIQSALGASVV